MSLTPIDPSPTDTGLFLKDLDPGQRAAVLGRGHRQALPAGALLFRQGDAAARLYLLTAGRAKVWRVTPSGGPVTIRYLRGGDLAGCVAVFCSIRYPATALVVEDAELIWWSASTVRAMLAEYPQLKTNALAIVGHRNAEMLERIEELSTLGAESRVARALLKMASGAPPGPLVARVSRQELGELTGTTLHTVSRIVSRWERAGWLKGGRQRIAVVEPGAIRNIFELRENTEFFTSAQRASG